MDDIEEKLESDQLITLIFDGTKRPVTTVLRKQLKRIQNSSKRINNSNKQRVSMLIEGKQILHCHLS